MSSALDVSATVGLIATGPLTVNILLGLLISTGYNPLRRRPRRRIKLFTLHYFRRLFGFHRWKQLHYTTYAAACVFFVHGMLSDPRLENRPSIG